MRSSCGPRARGPSARGPSARGPSARGPRARVPSARVPSEHAPSEHMRRASTCAERAERAAGQAGLRARKITLWNEALSFGAALLCRMYMPEGRARQAFHVCCVAMACKTRVCDASGASRAGVHTVIVALLSTF